jgi:hypothetical protein
MTLPREQLDCYLALLAGEHPHGRFIEIRAIDRAHQIPVVRTFIPAHDPRAAAAVIHQHSPLRDVYAGVALRIGTRSGGRNAILGSHLAHIECDNDHAHEALATFACPPTMVIASGTPGHRHAYWHLDRNAGNDEIEQLNRRLAVHLGGDLASTDIARVLRPPDTLNHKHHPRRAVHLLAYQPAARYPPTQLTAALTDNPPDDRPSVHRPRDARDPADAPLRVIPAATYAPALAGATPDRGGKIACPFHDDGTPSLQLYEHTFYCFGCRRGGSIYDFAAALWDLPTRGSGFTEIRRRLEQTFGTTSLD